MRTIIVAFVVVGLLLFAVVSSLNGNWSFLHDVGWRSGVAVMEAESRPSNRLSVGVASCNADPEVALLRESDVDVQIRVVSSAFPFRGGGDDCDDHIDVQLQRPLGDRVLIDKHIGQPVGVRRGVNLIDVVLRSSDRLALKVGSCGGDLRMVFSRETDVDVQLMLVGPATRADSGDDCHETYVTNIREPLGERAVIDMHTGQQVPVTRGPNAAFPAPEPDGLMPDVAPPDIDDPPNEAELQDLQRVADQKGISLQEAIDRYGWNDNFSLLVENIRSDFPAAYADSAIGDAGGAWIAFVGPAPEAALDMIDIFDSSHSGVTIEVRVGS